MACSQVCNLHHDAGCVGTDTALVTIIYDFSGFFPPVSNPPVLNQAKYDPSTDQYTYVWKTVKTWANTWRQADLDLV